MENTRKETLYLALFLTLCCFILRLPSIYSGMPYFQHEDEAHHFNRTVRMVQSGDWNPHYFHKPSLHFYLRAPVVAASFLYEVRRGNIRKIEEVRTKDSYGLAGYAFTASHPGIVKWNRAFSILLSLGILLLTFVLVLEITPSLLTATTASLLVAFSPTLLEHSATIGVDVPMSFFCILSSYLAVLFLRTSSTSTIYFSALAAGLAISTKYNALPIALTPLITLLVSRNATGAKLVISSVLIALGFIIASPFILASFPTFLNQLAYEIWHYGIAGHTGHTAEPGVAQALFYVRWIASDGVGLLAALALPIGILYGLLVYRMKTLSLLTFPLFFFLLMAMQRANFTRNMIVLIPYIAIFGALTIDIITSKISSRKNTFSLFLPGILICVLLAQPLKSTLTERIALSSQKKDSRTELMGWMQQNPSTGDIAISGELQLPIDFAEQGTRSRQPLSNATGQELYLSGFERVIAGNLKEPLRNVLDYYTLKHNIKGNAERQRVPVSPEVIVLDAKNDPYNAEPLADAPKLYVSSGDEIKCGKSKDDMTTPTEGHCWLNWKQSVLHLDSSRTEPGFLAFSAMSPWQDQKIAFMISGSKEEFELKAGEWQRIVLKLGEGHSDGSSLRVHTFIQHIHSPADYSNSSDTRRLGVAFKAFAVQ